MNSSPQIINRFLPYLDLQGSFIRLTKPDVTTKTVWIFCLLSECPLYSSYFPPTTSYKDCRQYVSVPCSVAGSLSLSIELLFRGHWYFNSDCRVVALPFPHLTFPMATNRFPHLPLHRLIHISSYIGIFGIFYAFSIGLLRL